MFTHMIHIAGLLLLLLKQLLELLQLIGY